MSLSFADHRVVAADAVVTRVVGDATVLLNIETGRSFRLDDVGTRAWTVLTTSPSIEQAMETLMAEYRADAAELRDDLRLLIDDLAQRGLAEVCRV
jgi:hypothetical protein